MSQSSQFSHPASTLQAFALEPILTPSGLIDGVEETVDATSIEVPGYVDPTVERSESELDMNWEDDSGYPTDESSDFSDLNDASPDDTWTEGPWDDSELESVPFMDPPEPYTFESGVFVVGESGEIGIDYLFDGGGYQGELAIFSLDGMDDFEPGSEAFIQEAARRAASGSDLGHVIVTDRTEGARFSGTLGSSDSQDFNSGDYLGVQTFTMRPGDEFGIMLVPNGRVEQLVDNPGLEGNLRPLFSLATNNPEDGLQAGQIVDVTGDGNTFVFEDLRLDQGSDRDYNDIIFQVRGAVGNAELMENWIDPANDWRTEDLGTALVEYAQSYIVETLNPSFDAPVEDQPLIGIIDTGFNENNPDLDSSRIIRGRDWIDGDDNPLIKTGEGDEHGTFVAGIIGATRDNDMGIDGINDQAPLWLGRAVGSGQWANSLIEFVDAAIESEQPNAVVNLSFDLTQVDADGNITTRYELTPQERAAIEYARQNNVLIVTAAGNDGGVMSVLGQASQEFDNIITVGAAERLYSDLEVFKAYDRSDYSSYGYGLDIMAQGGTIDIPYVSLAEDGIGTMAGTSVATAKVTGAVSQVWAANPGLSYRQIIEILKNTATDLRSPNWDLETGAGLLNIVAAVSLAKSTSPEEYVPPAFLTPDTWTGEGLFTPGERAVADQFMGSYYNWVPYTIRTGDTLSGIAFNTMGNGSAPYYNFIAQKNGIPNPNVIPTGQSILVPVRVAAPSQFSVTGEFLTIWNNLGGSGGILRQPTSNRYQISGGVRQNFQGGAIITSSRGTFPLFGGIGEHYLNVEGGHQGRLGLPTSGEIGVGNGVIVQNFEKGRIVYGNGPTRTEMNQATPPIQPTPTPTPTPSTSITIGGFRISGNFYPVFQQYRNTLGNPTSGIISHPSGATYQLFQHGSIVSSRHGTFPLYGGIRKTYLDTDGGLNGWLGAPTSAEVGLGNGFIKQTFENGYIIWNGSRATAYQNGSGTPSISQPPSNVPVNNSGNINWKNTPIHVKIRDSYFYAGPIPVAYTLDHFKFRYEETRRQGYKSRNRFLYAHLYDSVAIRSAALYAAGSRNAAELLFHYLQNGGKDKKIDVRKAIEDSPWIKRVVDFEGSSSKLVEEAKKYVSSMYREGKIVMGFQGSGNPSSWEIASNSGTRDWYLALGQFDHSYSASFKWEHDGSQNPRSGVLTVKITLLIADLYNFDNKYYAEKMLHEAGLAQNFFTWGEMEVIKTIPMNV
ncbi:S8 family serine peptidase [Leptolyngbya sp. CCY15150]|uniref:S8 family serine peptidase n=1 Tax=Leptolyngbya sp. CCY15150 TaxID=2767772 RepID=UPI00194DE710|nr:S8 family serine peptidase [Leptolyngbya sp. CCY15150]